MASLPRSLSFYLDFALANNHESEKQKSLADAVAEYVTAKEHEFAQECVAREDYDRVFSEWAARSMYPPDRRGLFTSTFDRIVELVSENQRARAGEILERRDFLPEFLFYTTPGKGRPRILRGVSARKFSAACGNSRSGADMKAPSVDAPLGVWKHNALPPLKAN